ncbi:flagellar basal-body MS-ring/collar protein FliF [Achromobacter xylosoxidans]|jgi:flagellar M-ring protein FliF|uniref:Flagellar M-ring protein n=2 Tax=Alcaligenes xylosoxydans xylosoxydans TaxID=85698 RepID=A0A0D6HD58_ALCXX|nr:MULTISPECIES: flagellar basal-body MS-ring/collar protein FliF [Achromobacter]AHC46930.1 Flagellar M-ring protein FliF [Achromobacter xylosoxidans NBRC 15126 = ATCC 27061]AMH06892.1 flagellar basal body M-ring protein FliF [Achromobacter xylosoxidans]EFV86471.1 flagellar M-ring protein FliF [Achromobacter xylosoxidans C54]KAA5924688.1 flagellar basal body M-ring protein FliF [Achromobacter xylosoxidans]KOQ18807.1 flagellar M-ring protein FliF [Achromobacter xylosoxidans]
MNQQATLSASLLAKFPVLEKIRALPKPVLLGAAAALVALIVAVAMWSSEPKYKVLFSNLDDRDGGAIVTALGTMNVPYKYNDTGTALLVPADRVYDARLQLASQGLPRGGSVGFELMDNARFGASQFAEQINYQRGLEGELARSIESMHTVQHARVHLAMPRQSLFVRERQPPTASVLLNVYPGRSLSDAQVSAISWLVASSVPELTAENVSIVDQNGRLLSAPTGEGRGMDADQMRMVRETEQRTVERILTILNPLVGPGNVHAQASAEMDFSRREETSEVYRPNQEPGQAAIRSQQTSESNQRGINPAQGVPGALSNQPPANAQAPIANPPQTQPPRPGQPQQQGQQQQQQTATGAGAQGAGGTVSDRRDATTNYEVDRTISHIKQPVGMLKRLSVAVVVNYVRDKDGEPQALPPEELSKLTNLVREAMGYSESRGDSLNLVNSQFNDGPPAVPMWRDPEMISLFKTILAWLVGGVLALWLYRKVRRSVGDYLYPPVDPEVAEAERIEAQREAQDLARAKETDRYQDNLERARTMANKDPRAVAMVLRTWMTKDEK